MKSSLLYIFLFVGFANTLLAQDDDDQIIIISDADRPITNAYRITEQPKVLDTVVPIPDIEYPLLVKSLETQISIEDIVASKIRITDKLDKLYRGYVKAGLGMYTSPLAEVYFNTIRNRRTNMGVHVKHYSSWGKLEGLAPSTYDNTDAKLFGEWFTSGLQIGAQASYLNNGYNFYGITDTTDFFSKDSLRNRVQGFGGEFKIGNFTSKDSAKVLWSANIGNYYFHEFQPNWDILGDKHARNNNFYIGSNTKYKLGKNLYNVDFKWQHNRYWYGEEDATLPANERFDVSNALVTVRPTISTYGDKWKVVYGLDMNFDFPRQGLERVFKVVPVVEGKYSLFNDMFIPYVGIDGGVKQNSFYTLNRENPYIYSGQEMLNETEYDFYGGIKGTLSKTMSFNVAAHYFDIHNKALYINENTWSGYNRFDVLYEDMSVFQVEGGLSYQKDEKLKIDAIAQWNKYNPKNEFYAWHLPEIKATVRGSYNLFDKIYAKADFTLEYGRKSPVYLFNPADDDIAVDMPVIADGNLHLEYRYNPRLSAFLQFNNIAAQKYDRWYNYRVQGFQVLGGVTFSF
ncbi:hypothetical protein K6119_14785 [Paracrocinitomix mangrovi]|uniref:hypothetical protein n=1 Tax=Paracrocinitomix mangrovi TaxID=2862509 RepID=UPI001C8D4294|nr:hypothetical protein [Paracrocinitomix mangrovi]UKN00999.1 hypothetical protein K6119_14785 [Paracrocinitomix mangrovi]